MKLYRDYRYGQRWQIETVVSMIKRNLGSVVAARSDRTRAAEAMLKVLTHNIMILAAFILWVFYRAGRQASGRNQGVPKHLGETKRG